MITAGMVVDGPREMATRTVVGLSSSSWWDVSEPVATAAASHSTLGDWRSPPLWPEANEAKKWFLTRGGGAERTDPYFPVIRGWILGTVSLPYLPFPIVWRH